LSNIAELKNIIKFVIFFSSKIITHKIKINFYLLYFLNVCIYYLYKFLIDISNKIFVKKIWNIIENIYNCITVIKYIKYQIFIIIFINNNQ